MEERKSALAAMTEGKRAPKRPRGDQDGNIKIDLTVNSDSRTARQGHGPY